jgi:superfamily II DNA/RNA helicase
LLKLIHIQDLLASKFDIIITSPEMCLDETHLRPIITNPEVSKYISQAVVDEAHCIAAWGKDFRKAWGDITTIRCLLPKSTPFLAQSATMPTDILREVRRVLCIDEARSFHLNLGNDRPNISQIVVRLKRGEDPLEQLSVLLKGLGPDGTGKLPRAICFFETRVATQEGFKYIRRKLAGALKDRVQYVHAGRTVHGRRETMRRFVNHEIDILCATEVVGMGQNIPDIEIVIIVKIPKDVSNLLQWIGRAGRDNKPARALILVEPSVFEKCKPCKSKAKKKKGKAARAPTPEPTQDVIEIDADDAEQVAQPTGEVTYRKKVDPRLRTYLEQEGCRRTYLNMFFGNPLSPPQPANVPCCDLCIMASLPDSVEKTQANMLTELDRRAPLRSYPPKRGGLLGLLDAPATLSMPGSQSKKIKKEPAPKVIARNKNRIATLTKRLEAWRVCEYLANYRCCSFRASSLLTDEQVDVLARDSSLITFNTIRTHALFLDWYFLNKHGPSLVQEISTFEEEEREKVRRALEKAQAEEEAKKTLKRKEHEDADRELSKAQAARAIEIIELNRQARERQNQPSWHKTPASVAGPSSSTQAASSAKPKPTSRTSVRRKQKSLDMLIFFRRLVDPQSRHSSLLLRQCLSPLKCLV